jgi:hypothetical protein
MVPGSDKKPGEGVTRYVYEVSKRLAKRGIKVWYKALFRSIKS